MGARADGLECFLFLKPDSSQSISRLDVKSEQEKEKVGLLLSPAHTLSYPAANFNSLLLSLGNAISSVP